MPTRRGDDLREFKPAMQELFKTRETGIVQVIASHACAASTSSSAPRSGPPAEGGL